MPIRVTVEHAGAAGGQQQVKVHLPAGLPRGALQLEVICGGFISPSQVRATCCAGSPNSVPSALQPIPHSLGSTAD